MTPEMSPGKGLVSVSGWQQQASHSHFGKLTVKALRLSLDTALGYLEKYRFFWEWQRDLKGSSLLKAAKWQLIEVPPSHTENG